MVVGVVVLVVVDVVVVAFAVLLGPVIVVDVVIGRNSSGSCGCC